MKIIPKSEAGIRLETEKGTFDVYELIGGGLEIHSQDGKTMEITRGVSLAIGAHSVVIRVE